MKNKICVYAICKNELQFVDKWLDNMSEADYIVVMDTGSTDGTFEKLKEDKRVTKVVQKVIDPWRFDVARNESMKLCPDSANILVCTDLDELFNKGWADNLRAKWGENTTRAFYPYAWSHLDTGVPSDKFMYDKAHTRDYHWKFPVHEVLDINDPEHFEQVPVVLDESEMFLEHFQDKEKERKSYLPLLKLAAEENKEDSHVWMLLAREYLLYNEYQKSLDSYLEVLKMPDVKSENKRFVYLETLGRIAQIYIQLGKYDDAIWYCNEFIKEDPTFREPYHMLAAVYNEKGLYSLAESTIFASRRYTTRKYTWVERAGSWDGEDHDIISFAQYKLGKYRDAILEGSQALDAFPDDLRLAKNLICFQNCYIKELENEKRAKTDKA